MRFPEFKEKYTQVKLGSISKRIQRKDADSTAPIMMLSAASGFIMQSEKYSRDNAGQSLSKYTVLNKGELAYNHGASKLKPYGCCFELKETTARIPYVYHCFSIYNQCVSYIAILLNNHKTDKQLKKLISSSVRMDGLLNISYDEYMGINITIPGLREQEKIVEFLSLFDKRIEQQRQLVEALKRYKRGVINKVLGSIKQTDMLPLKDLVKNGHVKLGRGNVIPKYKKDESKIYPVYSSSTHNDGLMGFYDSFMFDDELITWSIDGGGNFFYRKKHKFNVTNVCGILELDTKLYNYKFIAESLIHQHERKHFDYLSKAHPSVIIDMYKLPNIPIDVQQKYAVLFLSFDDLIIASEQAGIKQKQVKTALLQQMFI